MWLPLYFYWTEELLTTILNLTLKGNLKLNISKLVSRFFPLLFPTDLLLIQDYHFYQHLSQTPGSPSLLPSSPIPSHPVHHQVLLVLQDYYLQLTSHGPHSGQHHLPIPIKAPPQFILHMLACFFSARTLSFNNFPPPSNSTYPSTQL